MKEPSPQWVRNILTAPPELIEQTTRRMDEAAALPKAELPALSWQLLSQEPYLQRVYDKLITTGTEVTLLNQVEGLANIAAENMIKRETVGEIEGRLGYAQAFNHLQTFATAFTLQVLGAPTVNSGTESPLRVAEEYASWATNDIAARRQDVEGFLRGKGAGVLAHHLLAAEDETSMVGMYLRMNKITVQQLGEGAHEVSLAEPEAREVFLEGVLSALFAVRYNMAVCEILNPITGEDS